jgi:hypothetical protein
MDDTTELRRLEAVATEGPWGVEALPDGWEITGQPDGCYRVAKVWDANNSDQNFINPRFIAAMRNALPGLLDELSDYRNAVTWNVDCVGCAKHLDQSIRDYDRIKECEQRITELETALKLSLRQADPAEFVFACQGAELHQLKAAADELLLLKDDLKHSDPEEYERRKEGAWDALRKARGK